MRASHVDLSLRSRRLERPLKPPPVQAIGIRPQYGKWRPDIELNVGVDTSDFPGRRCFAHEDIPASRLDLDRVAFVIRQGYEPTTFEDQPAILDTINREEGDTLG